MSNPKGKPEWVGKYTTMLQTGVGVRYDLGKFEHPPKHEHPKRGTCSECLVVNAWMEKVPDGL